MWLGKFSQPSQPPDNVKLIFLVAWVLGSLFMLIDTIRLKTVFLDNDVLVIKNFASVIRVPLRNVKRISESRLMRPKTITLTVYPASDFGARITFIPQAKFQAMFNIWSEHPTVMKLRELTGMQE